MTRIPRPHAAASARRWLFPAGVGLAAVTWLTLLAGAQTVTPDPARIAEMHERFGAARTIQAAVIRGDLDAVRDPARVLAAAGIPPGLSPAVGDYARNMNVAARHAGEATTVVAAAGATARMLATCGACHRAAGTMPAMAAGDPPVVGGTVGHMIEHQRAIDRLGHGLMIPSNSAWVEGARGLRAAPLHAADMPRDVTLMPELLRVEEAVHRLAEQAIAAEVTENRVRIYSTLLARCADCHRLHRKIWGPGFAAGIAAGASAPSRLSR